MKQPKWKYYGIIKLYQEQVNNLIAICTFLPSILSFFLGYIGLCISHNRETSSLAKLQFLNLNFELGRSGCGCGAVTWALVWVSLSLGLVKHCAFAIGVSDRSRQMKMNFCLPITTLYPMTHDHELNLCQHQHQISSCCSLVLVLLKSHPTRFTVE